MDKKAIAWPSFLAAILALLGFLALLFVPKIIDLSEGFLGFAEQTEEKLPSIEELSREHFLRDLAEAYQYCGFTETAKTFCKCTVPVNLEKKEKIFFEGNEQETMMAIYEEELPKERPIDALRYESYPILTRTGELREVQVAGGTMLVKEFERIPRELCLHREGQAVSAPPDLRTSRRHLLDFLSPTQRVVVFFKEGAQLVWTTNAKEYWEIPFIGSRLQDPIRYWSAEPAVFWRKSDDARCLWLPLINKNIGKDELTNPVSECSQEELFFSEHAALFQTFVQKYLQCREEASTGKTGSCGEIMLDFPNKLFLRYTTAYSGTSVNIPDKQQFQLLYQPLNKLIAESELLEGELCLIQDTGEKQFKRVHAFTAGNYHFTIQNGKVCISTFPSLPSSAFPTLFSFDASIPDGNYLQTFITPAETEQRKVEEQYDNLILGEAKKQNVDFLLVKAIIQHESSWNQTAISPRQSLGLMQVTRDTARNLQARGLPCPANFDTKVESNIQCGISRLRTLLAYVQENGLEAKHTIAGYNAGEEALKASEDCPGMRFWECLWEDKEHTIRNTGYEETRQYVPKVLKSYEELKQRIATA